jgi:hypothetical protein
MWPSGNWATTPQEVEILYPKNAGRLIKPRDYGPFALGDTSEGLDSYEWELEYDGLNYNLGLVGQSKSLLFTESDSLGADLTFDQAGRAFVVYVKLDGVWIYWYDPTIPGFTKTQLSSTASNPFCTLDMRDPTQNDTSDILVFYQRANAIYYRISSDRYTVEYATPVTNLNGKNIHRCGIGKNNRFTLVYR